jgi:ABC-2 type transport system permease protein
VSRARLLASKLVAILLGLCVLAFATDLALAVGARLIGESLSAGGILALSVYLVLFPLTIGCFAAAISSVSSSRAHAAGIAAGVLILSYLIWVVGLIGGRWSWLQHLSVFSLFHPQEALSNAAFGVTDVIWLLVITAVCAAASLIAFQRRPTL